MNKSIMMGRLVRDPEIRYAQGRDGELAIANFRIAVDRKNKQDEKADFFKCTAFGRLAEFAEKYLVQGIKVIVTGEMRNDNYTNADGEKVYGVCLMANEIEFAESKAASQSENDSTRTGDNRDNQNSGNSRSNRDSNRQKNEYTRKTTRNSSEHPKERQESGGRRGEYRNSKERGRTHREDLDEEFRDIDECEEEYAFN